MRRISILAFVPFLALILTAPASPGQSDSVIISHGVASGDVTPFSAVLWTQIDREGLLMVQVARDPDFTMFSIGRLAFASAATGYTAKTTVFPLRPDTTYYYRWWRWNTIGDVGSFKTPPLPSVSADVRFAFSGDSDGTQVDGVRPRGDFLVLDAARADMLDFFVYLGDTAYTDSSLRAAGPAVTLEEYRDVYRVNREVPALRELLKATSTYAIWDDHEVYNDFAGETLDPLRYANGRQAFLENMPIGALRLSDPECAGDPLFRRFRWGKEADVIILDERSCRSASADPACLVELAPGEFETDLAPTLPTSLRLVFGALLPEDLAPLLQPLPPAGCLDTINDPSRTMLGSVQKQALKNLLLHSPARFKFIINEVPIQQFYALPYDRWEGYTAERNEILNFIRDNDIQNVVFLTTDTHANLINEVFIDRFSDPEPLAHEFVTGPIGTNTFEESLRAFFGDGSLGDLGVFAFHQVLNLVGVDCRHLDMFSYGLVEVDSAAGSVTIALKDEAGDVILDQQDGTTPCAVTLGF